MADPYSNVGYGSYTIGFGQRPAILVVDWQTAFTDPRFAMGGNPRLIPLLLGLGLRHLSMGAANIPRVKQAIRNLSIDAAARLARRVMEQSDPARISELVEGFGRES